MDALQMLKEDHDKVKKLLSELDSTTERGVKTRSDLFTKVKQELEVHEAIEEEIFYPALKEHPKAKELVLEAYEEHNVVDMVMQEIEGVPLRGRDLGREAHGYEGERRTPHRGRRIRDVQAGQAGIQQRGTRSARRSNASAQAVIAGHVILGPHASNLNPADPRCLLGCSQPIRARGLVKRPLLPSLGLVACVGATMACAG